MNDRIAEVADKRTARRLKVGVKDGRSRADVFKSGRDGLKWEDGWDTASPAISSRQVVVPLPFHSSNHEARAASVPPEPTSDV